jgi:tRNA(Ile2) C34 agmatinyltransferase TiaS
MQTSLEKMAERLEASASAYCPGCERRLRKADMDGGRCMNCGTMLCAVDLTQAPRFVLHTKNGDVIVRAENQELLERAMRGYGSVLLGATVEPLPPGST